MTHRLSHDAARLRAEALEWFVRRRDAGWRSADETAFQAWLAADPRHAGAYAQCSGQWHALDDMPADLVARMRRHLAHGQAAPAPSRRRFLAWPALSAVASVAIGGVGYAAWRQFQAWPTYTQALHTGRGQQLDAQLPDGTRLRLDTATRLEAAYDRRQRQVRLLDGQVVFAVQADAARPFQVLAGPLRVTVVGTRFAVRHTPGLPGNAGVQVAVEEGRVRVQRLAPGAEPLAGLLLTAGQQIAADAQGALGPVAAVPAGGIAPWRAQRISFVDVPLSQALAELERYGPTGLVLRGPEVAALRLSGTFDTQAADTLRKALPRVLPVRLRERDGQTEVLLARD